MVIEAGKIIAFVADETAMMSSARTTDALTMASCRGD